MTEQITVLELRKLIADMRENSIDSGTFIEEAITLMEEYRYRANILDNQIARIIAENKE